VPFSGVHGVEEGAGVHDGAITYKRVPIVDEGEILLPGVAGLQDATAAVAAGLEFGIGARAVASAVKRFRPLPHRLQVVAQAGGVTFIDDSKATNPHATVTAVKGLSDVVLIAGGRSKGIDLSSLRQTVPPVKAVVALGEASAEVVRVFEGLTEIDQVESMAHAVARAHERAHGKGCVLLSPGCASLDMYSSYAARGDDFAKEVARLLQRQERGENGGA
jgi:UDP-N-acetylmuramoylalanine--D-glutamate ligase